MAVGAGLVIVGASCNCGGPGVNPDLPDAGPGVACGSCTSDQDCDSVARCLSFAAGKACVPKCDLSKPSCPVGFTCKTPDEGGSAACVPDQGACCIDSDRDDYGRGIGCRGTDCDDSNAEVNPKATETCNGADDNCDGQIDEGLAQTTCGLGVCARTVQGCVAGVPHACTPGSPSAETCNNLDDDCNGMVDDGFDDLTCGEGLCRRVVAACVDGVTQTCTPGDAGVEVCNGLDDDCNSQVDDLPELTCGQGVCMRMVGACADGGAVTCEPGPSSDEACNGLDDDCDGVVDDGLGETVCGVGACEVTLLNCVAGQPQTCTPNPATEERCDGIDNNCDGTIDDGNPDGGAACNTGLLGVCGPGAETCTDGGVACLPLMLPSAEACNGLDDNCDGTADENNPDSGIACDTGLLGLCSAGLTNCANGALNCDQQVMATTEACDNLDNDCDGVVDNGNPGGNASCNTGELGVCAAGSTACQSGGQLVCNRNVAPSNEACNGQDDDCNGMTDEGNPAVMCPPPPNVGGTACSMAACQISGCAAGYYDVDGTYTNGCECQAAGGGPSCSVPQIVPTLSTGQTISVSGNLPPAGSEAWYTTTITTAVGNFTARPRVRVAAGAGFVFDVYTSCAGALTNCGVEGGQSQSRTDWELANTGGDPSQPANYQPPNWPSQIFVRVRRTTPGASCASYTILFSR